jgi:glycyl-tRNA synthetase alpha subunit
MVSNRKGVTSAALLDGADQPSQDSANHFFSTHIGVINCSFFFSVFHSTFAITKTEHYVYITQVKTLKSPRKTPQ